MEQTLASLSSDMLRLPLKDDYLFTLYEKLRSRIRFDALALFLPCDEGLRLAADQGFPNSTDQALPFSAIASIPEPGSPAGESLLPRLAAILGTADGIPIRLAIVRNPSGQAISALWAYRLPEAEEDAERIHAALGSTIVACSARAARVPRFQRAPSDLVAAFLKAIPPDRYAVAMLFYLSSFAARAKEAFPGLRERTALSLAVDSAEALLGSQGMAAPLPAARMALILTTSMVLDAELALFQLRKSFGRSFSFLTGAEAPNGESFSFDPAESGASEALGRFIAS